MIGEYETDENGNIAVNKLLKDKYIITEVEAPSGYVIKVADTEVNVDDFGADHSVTKTIVNPKEETTTTTTTTTTTEEPTTTSTTTTTTEEPKSTVTTTNDKPGLPETGERKGTFVTILGTIILVSSILVVRNSLKSKNN